MYLLRCSVCRTMRMHENGKCLICGYISSTRESINYLYGSKGVVKSGTNQGFSSEKKPGRSQFNSSATTVATYDNYSGDSCSSSSGSSSSDGGSSSCD